MQSLVLQDSAVRPYSLPDHAGRAGRPWLRLHCSISLRYLRRRLATAGCDSAIPAIPHYLEIAHRRLQTVFFVLDFPSSSFLCWCLFKRNQSVNCPTRIYLYTKKGAIADLK